MMGFEPMLPKIRVYGGQPTFTHVKKCRARIFRLASFPRKAFSLNVPAFYLARCSPDREAGTQTPKTHRRKSAGEVNPFIASGY